MAFLWFCAEFVMLPLYAGGLSKEEKEAISEKVEDALVDKKLPASFPIDDFNRLRIQNLYTQVRLLEAQIRGLWLDMNKITDGVLWERFTKSDGEKYEYRLNKGIFVLKKEE